MALLHRFCNLDASFTNGKFNEPVKKIPVSNHETINSKRNSVRKLSWDWKSFVNSWASSSITAHWKSGFSVYWIDDQIWWSVFKQTLASSLKHTSRKRSGPNIIRNRGGNIHRNFQEETLKLKKQDVSNSDIANWCTCKPFVPKRMQRHALPSYIQQKVLPCKFLSSTTESICK